MMMMMIMNCTFQIFTLNSVADIALLTLLQIPPIVLYFNYRNGATFVRKSHFSDVLRPSFYDSFTLFSFSLPV